MVVMANEVKTKGVSLFDKLFEKASEVVINVRGKNKYVVISVERYKQMRALELDNIYNGVKKDIADGRYTNNIDEHLKELKELTDELLDKAY